MGNPTKMLVIGLLHLAPPYRPWVYQFNDFWVEPDPYPLVSCRRSGPARAFADASPADDRLGFTEGMAPFRKSYGSGYHSWGRFNSQISVFGAPTFMENLVQMLVIGLLHLAPPYRPWLYGVSGGFNYPPIATYTD